MLKMTFESTPDTQQIIRWVNTVEDEILSDFTDFWRYYALPALKEEFARIFASEGYGTWPALAPSTVKQKAKSHPFKTILRANDAYFRAVTETNAPGNVYRNAPDEMEWGVDEGYFTGRFGAPYPIFHELGTSKMPARPTFALAEKSEQFSTALEEGLKRFLRVRIEAEAKKVFK